MLKDLSELTTDQRRMVRKVKRGKDGDFEVEGPDQLHALDSMSEILGIKDGSNTTQVQVGFSLDDIRKFLDRMDYNLRDLKDTKYNNQATQLLEDRTINERPKLSIDQYLEARDEKES